MESMDILNCILLQGDVGEYGYIKLYCYRVMFGEYGSGKTQLLIEKVRQTAWDLHYNKVIDWEKIFLGLNF